MELEHLRAQSPEGLERELWTGMLTYNLVRLKMLQSGYAAAREARSAVRNDLDVGAYLQDILERTLAGETDWAALAPHAWKAEHPESIRTYRQDERRQAADRKRTRRARRRRLSK